MILHQQKLSSTDTKQKTEDKNADKNNTDNDEKSEIDNTGNDVNKTDVVMGTEV